MRIGRQSHATRQWTLATLLLALLVACITFSPPASAADVVSQLTSATSVAATATSTHPPVPTSALSHSTTHTAKHHAPTSAACDPLPLSLPPRQLCDHIAAHCPSSGRLDYLSFYYCSSLGSHDRHAGDGEDKEGDPLTAGLTLQRVLAMACIAFWIMFLFSCLGLVASDFFCPNLGTLSSRLGLNETTAGVTFLALGNGSPDVFSTFAAMSSGSGQLAIGELIGAASFIVSVVAGCMMIVKPFKVRPYPFLRDVGFFTVGVAATMTYLVDGKLTLGECLAMVGLYFLYAATVIVGSLWEERKRRKRVMWEQSRSAYLDSSDQDDEPVQGDVLAPTPPRTPSRSHTPPNGTLLALESGRQGQLLSPEYQPQLNDLDLDPSEVWGSSSQARGRELERGDIRRGVSRNHSTGDLESAPLGSPLLSPSLHHASRVGLRPPQLLVRTQSRLRAGGGTVGALMPRHSLLGAVEFRDVVRSLGAADGTRSPGADVRAESGDFLDVASSRDPEQFLPHHHHHHHRPGGHQRAPSLESGIAASLVVATASAAGPSVSGSLSPRPIISRSATDMPNTGASSQDHQPVLVRAGGIEDPWKEHGAGDGCEDTTEQADDVRAPPLLRLQIPDQPSSSNGTAQGKQAIPSIVVVPEEEEEAQQQPAVRRPPSLGLAQSLLRVLCPSLRHWKSKSILGYILSVVNAPPLFILTLTLPVVDDEGEARAAANALGGVIGSGGALTLKGEERDLFARDAEERDAQPRTSAEVESILDLNTGERRVLESDPWKDEEERQLMANKKRDLDVAGALRGLSAQQMSPLDMTRSADQDRSPGFPGNDADAASICSSSSGDSIHFTPLSPNTHLVLSISQCFLAPPFLAWAVVPEYSLKWFLYSFLFSTILATGVLLLALRARHAGGYWYSPPTLAFLSLSRCFIGFCVSIAWISTVVNEVVAILQALGLICGLSDAILGLTIFAAGNSLADLVANVTIARAGYPIMAISACFAGPLLNLLLGIGLSGTYLLSSSSSSSSSTPVYKIELSPTLLSSGAGLLLVLVGTLIVAPLNGFEMGRKMGWGLIGAYSVVMATNLAVEISGYGRRR